jgi:hypothetical protein
LQVIHLTCVTRLVRSAQLGPIQVPAEDPSPIPGSGAGIISASETLTLQMTELAVMRLEKSFAELRRFAGR